MPTVRRSRLRTLFRWTSLSGQVAGMQVIVQGISAITGLLIVRSLAKEEYAWFTIASSMLATINLLADGGISTALTSIGGGIYQSPSQFSRLLRDGLKFSTRLAIIAFFVTTPLFFLLYTSVSAPLWLCLAAFTLAAVAARPSMSTLLLSIANRLHTRIRAIQISEVTAAVSRLLLTSLALLVGWRTMLATLTATVLAALVQAAVVHRQTREFIEPVPNETGYVREIKGFVKSLYANHVFFCVQAQVATWIVGWLASSNEVADLGALSRLSVVFTVFSAPFHYLALPAIARISDPKTLRQRFGICIVLAILAVTTVLLLALLQPQLLLVILGEKYMHLSKELPLALAVQGANLINTISWGMLLSRGWVKRAWIVIPLTIFGYLIGATFLPLNSVSGMLLFTLYSVVPTFLFGSIIVIYHLFYKRSELNFESV